MLALATDTAAAGSGPPEVKQAELVRRRARDLIEAVLRCLFGHAALLRTFLLRSSASMGVPGRKPLLCPAVQLRLRCHVARPKAAAGGTVR